SSSALGWPRRSRSRRSTQWLAGFTPARSHSRLPRVRQRRTRPRERVREGALPSACRRSAPFTAPGAGPGAVGLAAPAALPYGPGMRAPSTFGGRGRTTKVLWLVTAAAAVALIAIIVVGALWHRGGTSRRDAVAAYIDRVNAAQTQSADEANTIALAYAQFRREPGRAGREVQALARAERAMRVVRARVADVPAPADALALRTRLLRLFDLQIAFARVVRTMGAYLPRVAAIDARAAAQTRALLRAAASTRTAAQQARAFD